MILRIILTILIILFITYAIYVKLDEKYQKKIEELENTINSIKNLNKWREDAITKKKRVIKKEQQEKEKLNNQISELKEKLSSTIQEDKTKIEYLETQIQIKDQLLIKEQKKIKEKDKERIAHLGTIVAKDKKIENLEKKILKEEERHKEELAKRDYTINYLKKHMRAPTLKELKDYQFKRKKSSDKYV